MNEDKVFTFNGTEVPYGSAKKIVKRDGTYVIGAIVNETAQTIDVLTAGVSNNIIPQRIYKNTIAEIKIVKLPPEGRALIENAAARLLERPDTGSRNNAVKAKPVQSRPPYNTIENTNENTNTNKKTDNTNNTEVKAQTPKKVSRKGIKLLTDRTSNDIEVKLAEILHSQLDKFNDIQPTLAGGSAMTPYAATIFSNNTDQIKVSKSEWKLDGQIYIYFIARVEDKEKYLKLGLYNPCPESEQIEKEVFESISPDLVGGTPAVFNKQEITEFVDAKIGGKMPDDAFLIGRIFRLPEVTMTEIKNGQWKKKVTNLCVKILRDNKITK